jgi:hypothetical protein
VRLLRARVLAGEISEAEAAAMLNGKSPMGAQGKLRMWPTPVASEGADCGSRWEALIPLDRGGRIQRRMATLGLEETRETERARLNPGWVEWLMGFPVGWTDSEPSGTP